MKGRPGVAGEVFGALGRHNINISAIAQGASERNISCVIDASQQVRALNAIHQAFFETRKSLALVVVGVGNIGGALLRQLHAAARLPARAGLRRQGDRPGEQQAVRPVGRRHRPGALARDADGVAAPDESAGAGRRARAARADQRGARRLHRRRVDRRCVSGVRRREPAHRHAEQARERAAVAALRGADGAAAGAAKHFLYEANVGAGLPIMSTLRDLIASGDEMVKVEGIFSGTLSYLFNTFDGTRAVQRAREGRASDGADRAGSARRSLGSGRRDASC